MNRIAYSALATILLLAAAPSRAQTMSDCEKLKDSKRRADCFQAVAKNLAEEKNQENPTERFLKKAKAATTKDFLDPDSANFRNLLITQDKTGRTLCGEVNGKNTVGGYVGYRRFITSFSETDQKFAPTQIESPGAQGGIEKARAELFGLAWELNCVTFTTIWRE